MNKNIKIYFLAAGLLIVFNACRDMLDTDSSLVTMENEYTINNEREASSALSGIINELIPIADRYVLLGELRGDLMITSEFASAELKDIDRFQAIKENEYADKRDYYNIINNCNLLLQRMDTSLVVQTGKILLPYYVLTKTLRAWTYFQLGLTHGKVTYFTEPILDLNASLASYPEMQLDELTTALIDELKPYLSSDYANYRDSRIIPIRILLGDLYLYKNDYRSAASLYYDEIFNRQITVSDNANRWTNTNMENASYSHVNTYSGEEITEIPGYLSIKDVHNRLVNLSYNDKPSILPSENYVKFMSKALYIHAAGNEIVAAPSGDLRGTIQGNNFQIGDAYNYVNIKGNRELLICKFYNASYSFGGVDPGNGLLLNSLYIQPNIPVYRTPHLYLRFAEALNRLGKPTLAFAVMKYGLTDANVRDPLTVKVNPDELGEEFTKFPPATFFDNNVSMTARGRGNGVPVDTTFFVIPELPAKQDSILWVEDRLLEEMAAETPFEGNRFFDLLRVSRRRDNHPAYMAEKVSAKYPDKEAMNAKLLNPDIWFLP